MTSQLDPQLIQLTYRLERCALAWIALLNTHGSTATPTEAARADLRAALDAHAARQQIVVPPDEDSYPYLHAAYRLLRKRYIDQGTCQCPGCTEPLAAQPRPAGRAALTGDTSMHTEWRLHSDQQRANNAEWVRQFRGAAAGPIPVEPLRRAIYDGEQGMADMLQAQIDEYDAWRQAVATRQPATTTVTRIEDIGTALIRARKARGWTQARLGAEVGVRAQQIQQYEHTRYSRASLTRCQEVATVLDIDFQIITTVVPE